MLDRTFQLNIAICDDEPIMLKKLEGMCRNILEEFYCLDIFTAQSPKEFLECDHVFQIALLDVQLLESNGIQLAQQILHMNPNCRILFVSGYLHVVSDVYDVPHLCFILKDQLDSQLPKFLLRAAQQAAQESGMKLSVKSGKQICQLALSDIVFMERRGHWTYINLSDGSQVSTKEKLSELHARIGTADFVRCHISYIVNLRHVKSLENRTLYLQDETMIPISLPHEQEVRDAFFQRIGY